jgi:beta-galactosidase
MRFPRLLIAALTIVTLAVGTARAERAVLSLNDGWRFALGEHAGADAASYDDNRWRQLDLPHDWAAEAPFAADAAQGEMGGYKPGGIGWYRRTFDVPAKLANQQLRLEFDGVYMNSEVWLNGHRLGLRPYGYISFGYDLTPYLRPGHNVLAVRVDNSKEPSARWYHGCGIYAPVRLVATDAVHVSPWGVQVIATSITSNLATVEIKTDVTNTTKVLSPITLRTTVLNPSGTQIAISEEMLALTATSENSATQLLQVPQPQRWDVDTPALYTAVTEIEVNGRVTDTVRTRFGLREIKWDTATGFWLNGRNVKLKGVAEHLEGGPVGAAWPEPMIRWKLKLLKDMGCNAIRTAHNPQVPRFYELCDELGILVMDEIFDGWNQKAPEDYGKQAFAEWWERDLRDWLRRDRNHPSIIIWSVGNETKGSVASNLVQVCHELDSTRPVTSGHSGSEQMDVFGVNGSSEKKSFTVEPRPDKPFVATEAPHTWQVRGYYRTLTWFRDSYPNPSRDPFPLPDLTAKEVFNYDWIAPKDRPNTKQIFNSSYDNAMVRVTARKLWTLTRDLPWFSGQFRWTGWDYPGESRYVHGGWPFHAFMGGVIDLAGFPKDHFYFYQSQWTTTPMVHLLPHWTHPRMASGTPIPVWAYSNGEEVELLLNGHSLGRKHPGREWNQLQCEWLVPWTPGTLEAVAYRDGREVARTVQRTASAPTGIRVTTELLPSNSDGRDISIVTVAATDTNGTFYPYGENRVGFHLEGAARILTLENGSPVDTESNIGADSRRMFFGLTRAFVEQRSGAKDLSVVVGAICGEKRQLTSDQVCIDVQRVNLLTGAAASGKFEIFYTLDGSEPTPKSHAYTGSFPVSPGTTVRALVRAQGQPIMLLSERFAADEGLYWGAYGEPGSRPVVGEQAEDARFEGGVREDKDSGYNGIGYVDFTGRAGWVEWYQENDGSAVTNRLTVRYSATRGSRATLSVNGGKAIPLIVETSGSNQTGWRNASSVQVFQSGGNHIRLTVAGEGETKIDELTVVPTDDSTAPSGKSKPTGK